MSGGERANGLVGVVVLSTWGLVAGCSSSELLFLESPPGALILASRVDGVGLELEAFDPHGSRSARESAAEIIALGYDEPLADLGLDAGRLAVDPAGSPLPTPRWMRRAVADASSWEELTVLPADLRELRVHRRSTCLELDWSTRFDLEANVGGTLAISVDSTRVLVATSDGRTFWVRESGLEDVSATFRDVPRSAGHYDADRNELWMLGNDGTFAHGPPEGPFTMGPPLPMSPMQVAMTGNGPGEQFELYTITATTAVWLFDGTRWRRIRTGTGLVDEGTLLDITWQAPRLAWATGYTEEDILRIESGRVTPEWTGDNNSLLNSDGLRRVQWVGGAWGLVAGMRTTLRHRVDGTWRELPSPESGAKNFVIAELQGSLFFGGEDGVLNQIAPGPIACPAINYLDQPDTPIMGLVPLGNGLLIVPKAGPGPFVMKLLKVR